MVNHYIDYDYTREPRNYYTSMGYLNDETYEIDNDDFTPISNDEAETILDNFPQNMAIRLTPFSEYSITNSGRTNSINICATGNCGENLTWTLSNDGMLTISGYGEMTNYYIGDDNDPPWLDEDIAVKRIIFDGDITSIGENAFSFTSIKDITIPASVSDIRYTALYNIDTLERIIVENGNTIFSNDDSGVLFDINKTALIAAPAKLSGSYTVPTSVTYIYENAFAGCTEITSINWPDSVGAIGQGAFSGCTSLEYICIPSTVKAIDHYTFYNCTNLSGIRFSENITSIGSLAFANSNLIDVFYGGNEDQWHLLLSNCPDENLSKAKVYFNSY